VTQTHWFVTRRALIGFGLGLWVIVLAAVGVRAQISGPEWGIHVARSVDNIPVAASVGSMNAGWGNGVRPGDEIIAVDGRDPTELIGRNLPGAVSEVTFRDAAAIVRTARIPDVSSSMLAMLTAGALLFATLGALVYRWSADAILGRLFVLLSGAFATTLVAVPTAVLGYAWAGYLTASAGLLAAAGLSGVFLYFPRPVRHASSIARATTLGAACLSLLTLGGEVFGYQYSAGIESISWMWMSLNCVAAVVLLLMRIMRKADRRGMSPLLFGTALGVGPALVLNALPRMLGLQPPLTSDVTVIPVAAIPISFAYSILRHQIFALDAFMRRLVLRLSVALVGLAVFASGWAALQAVGVPAMQAAFLAVIGGGLAMPPIVSWTSRYVDALLYRPLHSARAHSISSYVDALDGLGSAVTSRLRQILPVQWAACVVNDDTTPSTSACRHLLGADGQLPLWLDNGSPLDQSPTEVSVAPILRFDTGVVLLLAGPRLDGARLDSIQYEAMRLLAASIAPSVEAALLRERAEDEARYRQGLTDLARELAAAATVNDVQRSFLTHSARLLSADSASLWRRGPDGDMILVDRETFGPAPAPELVRAVLDCQPAVDRERDWTIVASDGMSLGLALDDGGDEPMICFLRRISDSSRFGAIEERRARELNEHTTGALRRAAERELLEEQLRHRAFYDSLTGLPNRALFLDRIDHALARSDRLGHELAVLFIDLDRFKVVNDSLGHSAGDGLLVQVGNRLRGCLRESDTIARLGGDEFTVLLEGETALTDAARAADRILATLTAPFTLDGQEAYASASIGISGGSALRRSGRDLLREADIALYRAKATGRGRYATFESRMSHLPSEHLHMESELHRAIERNELRVHYQPIFALGDSQITGLEALVRWEHPEKGLVAPGHFIPLAEDTGLVVPIGKWVLEEACRQMREWQLQHDRAERLFVSVNLSARQLQDPALVHDVEDALRTTGLDPACLQLEITESVVMQEPEATVFKLKALKNLGVQLAVDDFGTGYSSLAYLKRFPIDVLKIDRAFVSGLGQNEHDSAIVQTVVTLARALGMQTTAEGIEERSQWTTLQELGCDHGQGYVFSRPLRPEAVETLFDSPAGPRLAAA
jgi:diguanylate cyclase (GGDEF)-like protein